MLGRDPPLSENRETLPGVLVNKSEYPKCFSLSCPCHHKVVAPHMIFVIGPQSDAGAIIQAVAVSGVHVHAKNLGRTTCSHLYRF